jgi:hypothetical protein
MINSNLTTLVLWLGAFLPGITDGLFSTQGIMVMLLVAYGGAMWMFLTSAPKVYTIMVSDLVVAQQFYEELLNLPVADVPLHYYYNYEQSLGSTMLDPIYTGGMTSSNPMMGENKGLWFQLKKNTQLHIIGGASLGYKNSQRHVCFDHECLDNILLRVQSRRLKYKIRSENPLNFLVKDLDGRVIEMAEAKT